MGLQGVRMQYAMNGIPWILVAILVTLVLLGIAMVVVVRKRKQPRVVDYRNYFVMGVVWIPTGLVLSLLPWVLHGEDFSFFGLFFVMIGLAYTIIGLVNRDKWGKQVEVSPTISKSLALAVVVGLLVFLLGLVVFGLFR
jgi:dolichyl-phosphate-mannose--protein O-mannosyl transferase